MLLIFVKNMFIILFMFMFFVKTYEKYFEMSNSVNVYVVLLYDVVMFGGVFVNFKVFSNSVVLSVIVILMSNDLMEMSMNCFMTV